MSDRKLIVLDFDGTLTDAEAEGIGFVNGYKEALQLLINIRPEDFKAFYLEILRAVQAAPETHGVINQGHIVAPAVVDPYLRMQTIANMMFDRLGRFRDKTDRDRLIELLFVTNYSKTRTIFRPGARELLISLVQQEEMSVCVVTNARTSGVKSKLHELNHPMITKRLQLHGEAQKFTLGPKPSQIPEHINLMLGKSRVAYPRRQRYYEVLDQLRQKHGLEWEEMIVIGDIFELDLLMPFLLGCTVILVTNRNTPQYEIDFMSEFGQGRAHVFSDLSDVQGFLIGG